MINSSIYENQGGGRIIENDYPLTIQNSTIISKGYVSIIANASGVENVRLRFNILQIIPDPDGGSWIVCNAGLNAATSLGGNIFSDDSCGPTAADAVISYSDMLLGPVANYGGWTPTIPLRPGSPAVNFGSGVCPGLYFGSQPLKKDQRGKDRDDGRCDSGSFELQSGEIPTVVYLPLIAK